MKHILILITLLFQSHSLMAYEKAFRPTKVGITELKELPAGTLLESRGSNSYFKNPNSLFRPLFRYIKKHNIDMTTPVEARINPGAMYFWVSAKQVEKVTTETSQVKVINIERRWVASRGNRGSYSKANFNKTKEALLRWGEEMPDITINGEPFAVYWSSPFVPWFMKKFEVQVEVHIARK